MRRGGAGLIAAVLALAGCKTPSGPKPADRDRDPAGTPAGRTKAKDGKGATWLEPAGKGSADPKSPDFDAKAAAADALGGKVVDETGRAAKNVFVDVELVGGPAPAGAPLSIETDKDGYFFRKGLKAGATYTLTAEATRDGKRLTGTVQARVPAPVLMIVLREDPNPPPGTRTPKPGGSDNFPPPPAPSDTDRIPAAGLNTNPAPRRSADGAYAPGGGPTGPVPATIGGGGPAPRSGGVPPPPAASDLAIPTTRPVEHPENVADVPRSPFQPPTASVPGPPVPKFPPPPPAPPPARVRPGANVRLVDALERDWDLATSRSGPVVLLEFVTTACPNCKPAVPVLKDLQGRYAAAGLQVVSVLCDDGPQKARAEAAVAYARAHDVNYAVYVEPGPRPGAVRDKLGVEAYPTAVLLGPDGAVLWSGHPVAKRAELEAAVRKAVGR